MKRLTLGLVVLLLSTAPASAVAARRGKLVTFTATTIVHNTGGLNYAGSSTSRQLGRGTITYTNTDVGDAIATKWSARLKHGTLKGTATSTSTPGATPPTRPRTTERTITLTLDGTAEFPVTG